MQKKKQKKSISNYLPLIITIGFFVLGFLVIFTKKNWKPNIEVANNTSVQQDTSKNVFSSEEKEFVNTKYGYSFTYDDYGDNDFLPEPVLTDESVKIFGMDSIVILIETLETDETNPVTWWSMQTTEPIQNKPTSCFSTQAITEIKSFYEPDKVLTTFKDPALAIELKNNPGCTDPSDHILVVSHNGQLLKITYDNATASEKILSTLKWF